MNIDVSTIMPVIEGIAQKLGVAAEHLWGVLVRQSITQGICDIVLSLFFGLIVYGTIKFAFICNKKEQEADGFDAEFLFGAFKWVLVVVGIIAFFITPFLLIDGIKEVINPEYYAFMNLVSQFK